MQDIQKRLEFFSRGFEQLNMKFDALSSVVDRINDDTRNKLRDFQSNVRDAKDEANQLHQELTRTVRDIATQMQQAQSGGQYPMALSQYSGSSQANPEQIAWAVTQVLTQQVPQIVQQVLRTGGGGFAGLTSNASPPRAQG